MNQDVILKISCLTKYYVSRSFFKFQKVTAVDDVTFEVRRGEIFGFLGPNGAGKTTTLNIALGITSSSAGTVELFGSIFKLGNTNKLSKVGYVPESTSLPLYYSVSELLNFYASLFNIPPLLKKDRINNLLEVLGLSKEKNTILKNLSMGQRRLVDIMQALINDPELIIMDEPTVYLDPVIMERLRDFLFHLKSEGKTIIISSHALPEIEKLSDRIAIIDKGRLLKVALKEEFMRNGSIEKEFLNLVRHSE